MAIEESKQIREHYNWDNVAKIGNETINDFIKSHNKKQNNNILNTRICQQ